MNQDQREHQFWLKEARRREVIGLKLGIQAACAANMSRDELQDLMERLRVSAETEEEREDRLKRQALEQVENREYIRSLFGGRA